MYKVSAVVLLLSALLIAPVDAYCDEPQVYLSKHFTLWYFSEGDFERIESLFREGPLKEFTEFGPEAEYLGKRLEQLYEVTASRVGSLSRGRRIRVLLLDGKAVNRDIYNMRGLYVTGGAAKYDPKTETLYLYAGRSGVCEFSRELAAAVMDVSDALSAFGESSLFVSAPAADYICSGLPESHLSVDFIRNLLY